MERFLRHYICIIVEVQNVVYLRAYVTPIAMHFDPIAFVDDNGAIVVAYGMAAIDLLRIKKTLPNLNKCGLLLVARRNQHYCFATFREIIVGIFSGFKEVNDEMGLSCAYDLQLKDISKLGDYRQLSRWITLKETERFDAENRVRVISSLIRKSRLENVLGTKATEIIEDLMWASDVFESLHALAVLAKTEPFHVEISSLRTNLRNMGVDLRYMSHSNGRILVRRKSNVTLMDCARLLLPKDDYYFEVESSHLCEILNMSIDKLPSHFRGYLMVDDNYVERLRKASVGRARS